MQEAFLDELAELARTAGVEVTGRLIQRVAGVNPRQILGQTKLAELEVLALRGQASLVVFDGELAPAQLHNLTELTERKVLDRTQLILDIFAQHATTRAASSRWNWPSSSTPCRVWPGATRAKAGPWTVSWAA